MSGSARDTLQVIAAASRAAGLDGWLEVDDPRGGDSKPKRFTFADIDANVPDAIKEIEMHDVCELVYDTAVPEDRHGNYRRAVLICRVDGGIAGATIKGELNDDEKVVEQRLREEWSKANDALVAPLRAHAVFLNGLGLITHVDEGRWNSDRFNHTNYSSSVKYSREATLFVVAILTVPDGHDEKANGAVLSLASRGDPDLPNEEEECSLPLNLPIFPSRFSAAEAAEYVKRKAIAPERLIELAAQWRRSGRNHRVFAQLCQQDERAKDETRYLVPGLVPLGMVTLLVGERGIGKSTLAHALAIAAGVEPATDEPPATWLRVELTNEKIGGVVALLSGEDCETELCARGKLLNADGRAGSVIQRHCNKAGFGEFLSDIINVPNLRLLIIDPARLFLDGNEDISENPDRLFASLQAVADKTGAAVILVHHLTKSAKPRSLYDFNESVRGSAVFLDRPRVGIGMYQPKRGGPVRVGTIKWNLTAAPFGGRLYADRAFLRDEKTKQLLAMSEAVVAEQKIVSAATDAAPAAQAATPSTNRSKALPGLLMGALTRLDGQGEIVTRTGRSSSLFGRKLPELKSYTRAAIDAQVAALVSSGAIAVVAGRLSPTSVN